MLVKKATAMHDFLIKVHINVCEIKKIWYNNSNKRGARHGRKNSFN